MIIKSFFSSIIKGISWGSDLEHLWELEHFCKISSTFFSSLYVVISFFCQYFCDYGLGFIWKKWFWAIFWNIHISQENWWNFCINIKTVLCMFNEVCCVTSIVLISKQSRNEAFSRIWIVRHRTKILVDKSGNTSNKVTRSNLKIGTLLPNIIIIIFSSQFLAIIFSNNCLTMDWDSLKKVILSNLSS